ncbi:inducible metalloproteinase inhibitor protein-like [Diabrotica virgifera virgifera]|uniref:Inducible metalloproteinase inhibitor protein-like n=1 Tax=Diabrotica virgifera virgifera TaxID=50390 RepID=A0A6P7FD80_DIAVI|nr:inducible metalloproteinase inhibitor protein-like [Diabrotica virgifera virgifera]
MKQVTVIFVLFVFFHCVWSFNTPPPGSTFPPGGLDWQNCTKPNEYYDCGSPCQRECKTLNEPCRINSFRCVDTCYCIQGYARDDNQNCIPEKDCNK